MKWLTMVLVCFLVVTPVNAASFDCGHAATRVEHMICIIPDISSLDEEMAADYQMALKNSRNAEALRRAQQTWLKQRNNCLDPNCVRDSYRRRLEQLSQQQGTSALSATEEGNAGAAKRKYPPYPDVWELQSPLLQSDTSQLIDHMEISNGDIWFSYSWQVTQKTNPKKHRGTDVQQGITFFGRQPVSLIDINREMTLPDGSKVEPLAYGYSFLATLADGTNITSYGNEYKHGCYQGPGENSLIHSRQNGTSEKWLQHKVVFLLLDKPVQRLTGVTKGQVPPAACDATEERINTRVVSLAGTVIPLQDGGFLLEDVRYGIVMRFDANLNTRSSLLNRRIFLMDSDAYERFLMAEADRKENIGEEGYMRMQSFVDDLYAYLLEFKHEGSPSREK